MARRVPKPKNRAVHPGLVGSWTKNRQVTKNYSSTFMNHAHRYGLGDRWHNFWNGEALDPKTAKTYGAVMFIALAILGGALIYQTLLFTPSSNVPGDPLKPLWFD